MPLPTVLIPLAESIQLLIAQLLVVQLVPALALSHNCKPFATPPGVGAVISVTLLSVLVLALLVIPEAVLIPVAKVGTILLILLLLKCATNRLPAESVTTSKALFPLVVIFVEAPAGVILVTTLPVLAV